MVGVAPLASMWHAGFELPASASARQPATVHGKYRAVHIVRSIRGKEHHGSTQLLGLAPVASGNTIYDGLVARGIVAQLLGVERREITRCYRVDIDACCRLLIAQQAGDAEQPTLAGGITRHPRAALE